MNEMGTINSPRGSVASWYNFDLNSQPPPRFNQRDVTIAWNGTFPVQGTIPVFVINFCRPQRYDECHE